ncbi:hypothetical protein Pfo_007338, partial [Paulownia fortunei]
MASLRQHQSNYDRVIFGSMCSETRRRRSTSQMCLHKILSIITTVPPPLATASPPFSGSETKESSAENDTTDENKGSGFDLNVGFCISPGTKESFEAVASGLSSSSTTAVEGGGGSAARDGGCLKVNLENGCDRVENEEHGNGVHENPHIKIEETEKSLTLLIEAAKLIFGEFKDNDKSEPGNQNASRGSELKKDEVAADIEPNERKLTRRSSCWTTAEMGGEFEETPSSPVVRSKRGRTQVLPCKYRDSVLEPLTRLSKRRRRNCRHFSSKEEEEEEILGKLGLL